LSIVSNYIISVAIISGLKHSFGKYNLSVERILIAYSMLYFYVFVVVLFVWYTAHQHNLAPMAPKQER
jgi:hypothetical protein